MTNIDLTNLTTVEKEMGGRDAKLKKKNLSSTIRKSIIKSLVIFGILTFGTVTFLCLIPDKDINSCKEALGNLFQSQSPSPITNPSNIEDLSVYVRMYYDKFQKCKTTQTFEDCCLLYSEMGKHITIQDCTVDGVLFAILKYDQEFSFDSSPLVKEILKNYGESNRNIPVETLDYNYDEDDLEDYENIDGSNAQSDSQDLFNVSQAKGIKSFGDIRQGEENSKLSMQGTFVINELEKVGVKEIAQHKRTIDEDKSPKHKKYKSVFLSKLPKSKLRTINDKKINYKPSYIETSVVIEKMSNPVIKGKSVNFETFNSDIAIFKSPNKEKRSVLLDPQNNMFRQKHVFDLKRNFPVRFYHPNQQGFGQNFDENDYHQIQKNHHEHIYRPNEYENSVPYYNVHNALNYEPNFHKVEKGGEFGSYFHENMYHPVEQNFFVQNPLGVHPTISNVDTGNMQTGQDESTSKIVGSTYSTKMDQQTLKKEFKQDQDEQSLMVQIPLDVEPYTSTNNVPTESDGSSVNIKHPFHPIQQVTITPKEFIRPEEYKTGGYCSSISNAPIHYKRLNNGSYVETNDTSSEDSDVERTTNENETNKPYFHYPLNDGDKETSTVKMNQNYVINDTREDRGRVENSNENRLNDDDQEIGTVGVNQNSVTNDTNEDRGGDSAESANDNQTQTTYSQNRLNDEDQTMGTVEANQNNVINDTSEDSGRGLESASATKKPYLQNRLNDDDQEVRKTDELRNVQQDNFQNNAKIATSDLQIGQHSLTNPNFNQQSCVPSYSPQVSSPYRLIQPSYGYDPNPRFAQLIPIPRTPTNSYVINPQYTYVNPNYPQIIPNYVVNGYYNNQNVPNTNPIQVSGPGGQYYVCNPIPAPTNQLTNIPGVEVRQSGPWQESLENTEDTNGTSNKTRTSNRCPFGEQSCADDINCIKISHICDGDVNCDDGSDETFCSCKSRVGPSRLCDGYLDCPNGEDETGCFGCRVDMFNCDDWSHDRGSSCILMEERCDGVPQCPTGRDEENCSILTEHFAEKLEAFKVSKVMGYLYRNHKGKWYPSCSNPEAWALDVCRNEAGPSDLPPLTHMVPIVTKYNGPYINALPNNEAEIVDTCVQGHAVYVECPHPTCGMRMSMRNPYRSEEVDTSNEEDFARFRYKRSNQTEELLGDSRVVGGKPSQPAAWPWIVSIYRNGVFHCGGVLVSETCVVTAAHCVDKFTQYFYEVEAGILRRFSYSPMEQTRYVSDVIAHQAYDRANLKNDLALMRLSAPLKYNRYVRPICLPNEHTAGHSYLKGPPPETLCTAVGWGATVEHGSDPDHLREVEVPVLRHCKHREDEEGHEICAGFIDGGRDACQGDSGGPFMCRNPNQPNQWYLAGIVSHGEGCARPNEPGVYTRVSLYRNWIYENAHHGIFPSRKPLHRCPGFVCKKTGKCIPKKRHCDRVVDCLLADDEIHCERSGADLFRQAMRHMVILSSAENSSRTNERQTGEASTSQLPEINGTSIANISNDADAILIIESRTPIPDVSIEENFDSKESPDSFTTRSTISGGAQFVTNSANGARTETGITALTSHESTTYYGRKVDYISDVSQNKTPRAKHFRCKKMLELIPLSKRCDKIADCQDATDEVGCTCRDYLGNFYPAALCDGITDCYDFSDEKGCDSCQTNEFRCPSSNVCINIEKICNNIPDCPQKEDESDCFALIDGRTMLLDGGQRPLLKPQGIFTFHFRGSWLPMCANWTGIEATTATTICLMLGFTEYERFSQLKIEEKPIDVIPALETGERFEISQANCNALFVKCSNVTINSNGIDEDGFETEDRRNLYPWNAAIFVDGKLECMGTLINLEWVLTSTNCFPGIVKLQRHYIAVLLGSAKAYTQIAGPYDEVHRVAKAVPILFSDIVILRLNQSATFSRYVRPINFSKRNNIGRSKEICVAVGKDRKGELETIFLQPVLNCTSGSRCFKRTNAVGEECNSTPWSGSIICDSGNGFTPVAVYYEKQGECGFEHTTSYTSISLLKRAIFNAMEQPVSAVDPPECYGFRCKLGRCLEFRAICDGIPDCRDGADEDEAKCAIRDKTCHLTRNCDCKKSEMKCHNGRCVPKSTFCNGVDECGDNSDEPSRCNCRTYLELSSPEKICDGITNCQDKSDELPETCGCVGVKFKCSTDDYCVPTEMVCDGQPDCPDGKDEETCLSLRSSNDNLQIGEVMTNTAGVWHPGCFPERPTTTELESICAKLGFTGGSASLVQPEEGKNASVPQPTFDTFSLVRIHGAGARLKVVMRTGREPFLNFVDSDDCHRLFVHCL